jgi:PAS domain S-box-containing protein
VTNGLDALGGDLHRAVHSINVPSYALDATGVIRWINPAAERLVGDVRGRQFTSVVAPHETRRARELFARKMIGGAQVTDAEGVLLAADGGQISVDISAVPLKDGHRIVGVFGQISDVNEVDEQPFLADLTPRQAEILRLLEWGKSTEQIAGELQLSQETVRNHIRRLFRALDVHTRLEAVARARISSRPLEQAGGVH